MYRRWCILSLCVVSAVVTHDFSARPVAAAWQPSTVKHSYPAKPAAVLGSTTSVAESAIEQFIFRRNTNGTAPEPTCRDSSHHLCPNKQYCCPSGQACTVNKETNGRECKTKQCIDKGFVACENIVGFCCPQGTNCYTNINKVPRCYVGANNNPSSSLSLSQSADDKAMETKIIFAPQTRISPVPTVLLVDTTAPDLPPPEIKEHLKFTDPTVATSEIKNATVSSAEKPVESLGGKQPQSSEAGRLSVVVDTIFICISIALALAAHIG